MYELVDRIKTSMRISHNLLDQEILENLETCALDLERAGVQPFLVKDGMIDRTKFKDKLVEKAGELYYKWQTDFQEKGDQFERAYKSLRDALSLSGDYRSDDQ